MAAARVTGQPGMSDQTQAAHAFNDPNSPSALSSALIADYQGHCYSRMRIRPMAHDRICNRANDAPFGDAAMACQAAPRT